MEILPEGSDPAASQLPPAPPPLMMAGAFQLVAPWEVPRLPYFYVNGTYTVTPTDFAEASGIRHLDFGLADLNVRDFPGLLRGAWTVDQIKQAWAQLKYHLMAEPNFNTIIAEELMAGPLSSLCTLVKSYYQCELRDAYWHALGYLQVWSQDKAIILDFRRGGWYNQFVWIEVEHKLHMPECTGAFVPFPPDVCLMWEWDLAPAGSLGALIISFLVAAILPEYREFVGKVPVALCQQQEGKDAPCYYRFCTDYDNVVEISTYRLHAKEVVPLALLSPLLSRYFFPPSKMKTVQPAFPYAVNQGDSTQVMAVLRMQRDLVTSMLSAWDKRLWKTYVQSPLWEEQTQEALAEYVKKRLPELENEVRHRFEQEEKTKRQKK